MLQDDVKVLVSLFTCPGIHRGLKFIDIAWHQKYLVDFKNNKK